MADDGFGFDLALIDHMTATAQTMGRSLDGLAAAVDDLSKRLDKSQEKLDGTADKAQKSGSAIDDLTRQTTRLAAAWLSFEAVKGLAGFAEKAVESREQAELAYGAALGTAELGLETFNEIESVAKAAHMPAEKAQGLAQELMLQGLEDTRLIGKTIEAEAALMRTGQLAGAEKLKKIVERSIIAGHFEAKPKALAGLGLDAALAKELTSGKLTVEAGLEKIDRAIQDGPIGKAAASRYGFTDFTTDVGNSFREMAEGADPHEFNDALRELAGTVDLLSAKGGLANGFFQTMFDGAAGVVRGVSKLVDWTYGVAEATSKAMPSMGADWKGFKDTGVEVAGAVVTGLKYLVTFIYGGVLASISTLKTGFMNLGAVAGFAFDVITDPLGNMKNKWDGLTKTISNNDAAWKNDLAGIGNLEQKMLDGTVAASKQVEGEKAVEFHAHRAGKGIEYMAKQAKAAKESALGPEDLYFLATAAGAVDFSTILGTKRDESHGGFAERMGLPAAPGISGFSAASFAPSATPIVQASGTTAAGGRSVALTWYGDVYVGSDKHEEAELRPMVESALIDALERLRAELVGA